MNNEPSNFRTRFVRRSVAVVITCGALLVAVGSAVSSTERGFGMWAPGISGDIPQSAGTRVSLPDPRLARMVSESATRSGGSASEAIASLRLMQANRGQGHVSLYSFTPGQEALCLVVAERSVVCPTAERSSTPGVLWVYDGGYFANVQGSPGFAPPAIVGLTSSRVEAVALEINGVSTPLGLTNNTFFQEVDPPSQLASPFVVSLIVKYRDGTVARVEMGDPRT